MTAIAQRLDRRLKTKAWRPQTAREVKVRVAEIIAFADRDALTGATSPRDEGPIPDTFALESLKLSKRDYALGRLAGPDLGPATK